MEVVKADDGSMGLVGTERHEQSKQFVDRFVLQFQDAEIEFGGGKIVDDVFKLNRPGTATDVGGGQFGGRHAAEKFASGGLGEELKPAHLVGTKNARLALARELFEKLPAEGGLAGSGSRADDVEPRIEKLKSVEVIKAGATVGIIFQLVDFSLKMICEEVSEGKFLGRDDGAADLVESQLGFGDDVGRRELSEVGVLADDFGSEDESAQVSFLFDDVSVVLGEGGGVGGVDEVEQVQVVDFFVVAVLAELLFDGEEFDGFAGGVKADDGFENELVFGAVEVVGVDNGENFGNNETLIQEHGGEKLFLHFDIVREVIAVKHENHLVESEGKEKTTLTKVNAVLKNSNRKKPLQKISLWYRIAEVVLQNFVVQNSKRVAIESIGLSGE